MDAGHYDGHWTVGKERGDRHISGSRLFYSYLSDPFLGHFVQGEEGIKDITLSVIPITCIGSESNH